MMAGRSNCLIASFHIWRRFGGRLVVIRGPGLKALPWSLLPHVGIEVSPGWVVHYACLRDNDDFPLWFRGRLTRDWCGEP